MKYLLIIITGLIVLSCSKGKNNTVPYYYSYFPLEVNSWISYDVNEIIHTSVGSDTANYLLKELITEQFLDDQGRVSYRVERYWKSNASDKWTIKDVWVSNLTKTSAEKVEENVRYAKLVFPVNSTKYWDGNAYNSNDEWQYYYDSLHVSKNINQLKFDSTITVKQRDNINAVETEVAEEIYANHIGLVYRKLIDYDLVLSHWEGVELEMIVNGYGK